MWQVNEELSPQSVRRLSNQSMHAAHLSYSGKLHPPCCGSTRSGASAGGKSSSRSPLPCSCVGSHHDGPCQSRPTGYSPTSSPPTTGGSNSAIAMRLARAVSKPMHNILQPSATEVPGEQSLKLAERSISEGPSPLQESPRHRGTVGQPRRHFQGGCSGLRSAPAACDASPMTTPKSGTGFATCAMGPATAPANCMSVYMIPGSDEGEEGNGHVKNLPDSEPLPVAVQGKSRHPISSTDTTSGKTAHGIATAAPPPSRNKENREWKGNDVQLGMARASSQGAGSPSNAVVPQCSWDAPMPQAISARVSRPTASECKVSHSEVVDIITKYLPPLR